MKNRSYRNFEPVCYRTNKEMANCLDFSADGSNNNLIIGSSSAMKEVYQLIEDYSKVDEEYPVLISGETGTGKELAARAIGKSYKDRKPDGKFVTFNCALYPESLVESELFGYERGSFTGATKNRIGIIETANNGILFLDDLGNMPMYVQKKILRAVENKESAPIGCKKPKSINFRIIAATNENIQDAMRSGKLRKDLIYRLNTCPLYMPPLRERREDICSLANYFLGKHNNKYHTDFSFDQEALYTIQERYDWPGNVRELENVIKKIGATQKTSTIEGETIRKSLEIIENMKNKSILNNDNGNTEARGLHDIRNEAIRKAETQVISKTLDDCHWNAKLAAQKLDISYKSLLLKIKEYGMNNSEVIPTEHPLHPSSALAEFPNA